MYSQLTNISYDKSLAPVTNIRVNDIYIDGKITPTINMSSSRYNVPFTSGLQVLSPSDPNPSYLLFTDEEQEGLYNYDNNNGDYSLTSPDTITINTSGYYCISLTINCSGVSAEGNIYFQVFNSQFGPIGTVPPICTDRVMIRTVPFPAVDTYIGVGNSDANCYLTAGSLLKIAYITEIDCTVTPTSCLCITKLSI